MYDHTQFDNKKFSHPKNTFQTNSHWDWHSEVLPWPWPSTQQPFFFSLQDMLAYEYVPLNQVWLQKSQQWQFRRCRRNCQILIIWLWVLSLTLTFKIANHDLDLEDSKQIFLHDTQAHDEAPPYQFWQQNVWQLKHSVTFWSFSATLTLNTASFFFTWHSHLWWCTIKPCFAANESQFIRCSRNILWLQKPLP